MRNSVKSIVGLCLLLSLGTQMADAQCLTLKKKYTGSWNGERMSHVNKPNGSMYRLREELQCPDLPFTPMVENNTSEMIQIISERIDTGWMALYRNELGADTYKFLVLFYNNDKVAERCIDLCEVSNTYNCEVQDIRWDAETHYLYFNMACPSYSDMIDGKGSKLFCYDVEKETMVWSTPYLTSNDIFIIHKDYVFCGYGFTNEKDYVFMVDKMTGKIYSKILLSSAHQNLEVKTIDGKDYLYLMDYNEYLYIYNINKTTPKAQPRKPVQRKKYKKK